ncbi:DNA-directed RNA polymerase subunit omega [Candidatus Azoamicus ciliaticola]|uniref:DNA-directed RNA polymerase subunit omega n=1 Tax=Candidatus Azoamicus ciliaticola TaxID=2652803 RepID=A0A6J5JX50_9GAMM|nr:DNA-directed RNA polymerase subunit omega [Candidatus Azoamicus ciliaticola]CAB3976505.1 DNA-directed RNA polymerase subunit omega [Candidatus Azoamicus ciliaticola]
MSDFVFQDCYKSCFNKFELVLVASKRAKDISFKNSKLFVDPLKNKSTVIALREIEGGFVNKFSEEK